MEEYSTEWMDEVPYHGPPEEPDLTIAEAFANIGKLFQNQVVKPYILIGKQLHQAFTHAISEEERKRFEGIIRAYDDAYEERTAEQKRKDLLEQRRALNHGPRPGSKYRADGKQRW